MNVPLINIILAAVSEIDAITVTYANAISHKDYTTQWLLTQQRTWTAAHTTPLFGVEADVAGTRIMGVRYALRDD